MRGGKKSNSERQPFTLVSQSNESLQEGFIQLYRERRLIGEVWREEAEREAMEGEKGGMEGRG